MNYVNKKNGRTANLIESNDKFNTVLLQYVDDESTTSVSNATLKRWWKPISQEQEEDDMATSDVKQEQEVVNEVVTPEASTEEKAPDKSDSPAPDKKKSRKTHKMVSDFTPILDYADELAKSYGGDYYVREKQKSLRNYRFPNIKSVSLTVRTCRDHVEIRTKSKYIDGVQELVGRYTTTKRRLDARYSITDLTSEVMGHITQIMKAVGSVKTAKEED